MAFIGSTLSLLESPEQEVARLAAAPQGSRSHFLSGLPVQVTADPRGSLIELPAQFPENGRVVVVAYHQRPATPADNGPGLRHHASWDVIVVASTDRRYPVGGFDLAISEAELVRGRVVEIQVAP
ncbi:MAG: hypothetical protein L0K65_04665 [Actinomyces sp.]|nr:hypothetical protein [Actinomyces sp.]